MKVYELNIVLRATQTLDILIFFKKKFCLMSGMKFTLSDATSILPDDLCGLKTYIYSDRRQSHEFNKNEEMQMVFTTEEFLEVALESWSEWDLNP